MPLFVVQLLSCIQLFGTPWTAAHQTFLSFTISWSLLKLMSIESVIQPFHPLLSPSPPALSLSQNQPFPVSQLFASVGQSTGASVSASVLPGNIQDIPSKTEHTLQDVTNVITPEDQQVRKQHYHNGASGGHRVSPWWQQL